MKKQYTLAGISIFFWSTLAVSAKLLLKDFSNIQVLCASTLFAAAVLLAVNIATGKMKILNTYTPKDYLISVLIGLPGMLIYYLFYYAGAAKLPASQAFIINYLWPIMSIVFACIILKEKMTVRKMLAVLMSFAGVAVVAGGELASLKSDIITGSLFCMTAAVLYGLFTALNQKMQYDKCISMMINFVVAFAVTGIILAVNGDIIMPNTPQLLGLMWNGIFTMAIPNTAWIIALEGGNTAKISNLAYITPFASLIWSNLILHEPLTVNCIAGLVIIVLGIFIQLKDNA